jgi:hypothetical protein
MKRSVLNSTYWSVYFLVFYMLQHISNWWALSVSGIRGGNFIDLNAVLKWADCLDTYGASVYKPADGDCGGYLYGSALLRILNFLGISAAETQFWGMAIGAVFCVCLGMLAAFFVSSGHLNKITVGLVLSSPPLWLLVERGNIDLLIFLLVISAAMLFARGYEVFAILLIAISALFKFYTLPLLLVLAITSNSMKSRRTSFITFLIASPLVVIDYLSIQESFPSTWFISFGLPSIGFWINVVSTELGLGWPSLNFPTRYLFGLSFFAASIAVARIYLSKVKDQTNGKNSNDRSHSFIELVFLMIGTTFTTCYLLGMNYDYRLVFAAVSGLALLSRSHGVFLRGETQYLLLASLWLSSYSFGLQNFSFGYFMLIQILGDATLGLFSAIVFMTLFNSIRSRRQLTDAT